MDDILGLISGLLQAGSAIYTGVENNQQAQTAETQRNQQYTQLNNLVNNPDQLMANIMKLKRSLSADEKEMITQTVVGQMVASGQGGAPGIINAAVDYALQQADAQLFQQAASAYLGTLGLPLQALRSQPPAGLYPTAGAASGAFSGPAGSVSALTKALQKALNPSTPGLNYTGSGWQNPDSAFGGNFGSYTYDPGMAGAESSVPVPGAMDAATALAAIPIPSA